MGLQRIIWQENFFNKINACVLQWSLCFMGRLHNETHLNT